jgi:uncharacterized damage-inducible protein DinB
MKATEARMAEAILDQLEREAPRTRRVLEQVPEGRGDWKPHDKSMPLGMLAGLVATMPSWLAMIVHTEDLDLNPPGGAGGPQTPPRTRTELLSAHDKGVAESREALQNVSEDRLRAPWKLLVAGKVVMEDPRHVVLWDTLMHLSHHRGQLTVYLRLNGATVPSVYGPTADDPRFA